MLAKWNYKGKELEHMTDKLCSNPEAWLQFMMAFELKLSPVERSAPFRSFLIVITATIVGSAIPLIPFLFTQSISTGLVGSVILSALTLFLVGYYEAKTTIGSIWKSGLQMVVIGMLAGFAGYLIGHFLGAPVV